MKQASHVSAIESTEDQNVAVLVEFQETSSSQTVLNFFAFVLLEGEEQVVVYWPKHVYRKISLSVHVDLVFPKFL